MFCSLFQRFLSGGVVIVERCVLCSKVHILVNMEHSGTMILKAQIKIVPVRTPPNQVCDLLLPVKPRLPQTLYPTEKTTPQKIHCPSMY